MSWRVTRFLACTFGHSCHGVCRRGGLRVAGLAALALGLIAMAFSPARAESFSARTKKPR